MGLCTQVFLKIEEFIYSEMVMKCWGDAEFGCINMVLHCYGAAVLLKKYSTFKINSTPI